MDLTKKYIKVSDLEVYRLARELSQCSWKIYEKLEWQDKKTIGDQFIRSADSFGANIVEGYNRFHYLDKIKFYYNARGSFAEANDYWIELLLERSKISQEEYQEFKEISEKASIKFQNFITANYNARDKSMGVKQ